MNKPKTMTAALRRGAGNKKPYATKTTEAELDALIEEATVDAYGAVLRSST
jgi:hypothetical protein